jgi:hypothetical protein
MNHFEQWFTLDGPGKHIVFISGDEEYRSEEALPMLAQVLATHHGFRCTVLFAIDPATGWVDPNVRTNIPGMHWLATADLVVLFVRFRELPDPDMAHFVQYVFGGKPLLALRTSTHAFRYTRHPASPYAKYSCTQPDGGFGRQVLGETWVAHHGRHGFEATRGVPRFGHSILQGVGTIWCPTDVYGAHPPGDVEVLVDGQVLTGMNPADPPKPDTTTMPAAWIRQPNAARGTGRIFCTTMGAAVDLQDASLRRLIVNGCYWCLGREAEISLDRSSEPVGEYRPSPYGLRREPLGKWPRDFFTKGEIP